MRSPKIITAAACLAAASVLAACGGYEYRASPPSPVYGYAQYGVVDSVDYVTRDRSPSGAGAVVGGVAGGVLGHQIGGGRGNTAATIAGAIGGALLGNEVERRHRRDDEDFRVNIRMEDGSYRSLIMSDDPNLRAGDPVAIDNGRIHRR